MVPHESAAIVLFWSSESKRMKQTTQSALALNKPSNPRNNHKEMNRYFKFFGTGSISSVSRIINLSSIFFFLILSYDFLCMDHLIVKSGFSPVYFLHSSIKAPGSARS